MNAAGGFDKWLADRRAEVKQAAWRDAGTVRSLSIQDNVSTLSHELSLAQAALTKIRTIHRPDPTGSWCAHCQWEWPCRTFIYAGGGA